MTKLFDYLKLRIESEGSITLADYMAESLGHSEFGYYNNTVPLGKSGDFITSPEVSQMFGELIGLWSAVCWQQLGTPNKFNFIELGPGRGTLLMDAIRAAKVAPGYLDSIELHLVETSPILAKLQKESLSTLKNSCLWYKKFEQVPDGPFFLIGNEFIDTLPIRQYIGAGGEWYEQLVGLNKFSTALCRITSPTPSDGEIIVPLGLSGWDDGIIWEICHEAQKIISSISSALLERGGVAIFIDYGYVKQTGGDTFQAVRNHEYSDPLEAPGLTDLTAHVDFEAIKQVAEKKGVRVSGPVTQGAFLRGIGIEKRAEKLMNVATPRQKRDIETGVKRLIDDNEMGRLFKVMALSYPETFQLEGFCNAECD